MTIRMQAISFDARDPSAQGCILRALTAEEQAE